MIGEGIIDSRDCPLAITMDTFQEYLMWSSVVPAVPCTTSVELRQIAAASSSASQLLPVPGSPMSSRPRSEARVTMERSTKLRSPNHFWEISRSKPSDRSEPRTNRRIIFGDRRQEKGLGLSSMDSSQSSSSAYLISAGARSRSDIVRGSFQARNDLSSWTSLRMWPEITGVPWSLKRSLNHGLTLPEPELLTEPTGMNLAPERWM